MYFHLKLFQFHAGKIVLSCLLAVIKSTPHLKGSCNDDLYNLNCRKQY